jgi:hypothetical protein
MIRVIAAASLLGAISSALDGRYRRAVILSAAAAGVAVAGRRRRSHWLMERR